MKNAIQIKNIKKVFKRYPSPKNLLLGRSALTTALDGVSIDIKEGEIFGLLGPNGAGKTTLIKVLTTLILPTEGTATVCGYDVINDGQRVRNNIGLIHSDERSFFWRLTGRQNLEFFASIYKIPKRIANTKIDEVIAHIGLQEHAENLFHNYSTGMKQRLAIARGLLNSPRILFMDEAMRSIDPISTRKIRDFIKRMIQERKEMTIVIATNRLDEAVDLCDRVAILNSGHLVNSGYVEELMNRYRPLVQYEIEVANLHDEVMQCIRRMRCVHKCEKTFLKDGNIGILLTLDKEEESIHLILREIISSDGYILRCERKGHSFEETFNMIINKFEGNQIGVKT